MLAEALATISHEWGPRLARDASRAADLRVCGPVSIWTCDKGGYRRSGLTHRDPVARCSAETAGLDQGVDRHGAKCCLRQTEGLNAPSVPVEDGRPAGADCSIQTPRVFGMEPGCSGANDGAVRGARLPLAETSAKSSAELERVETAEKHCRLSVGKLMGNRPGSWGRPCSTPSSSVPTKKPSRAGACLAWRHRWAH